MQPDSRGDTLIAPAETVPIGRTSLRVSRLGLGMRALGLLPPARDAEARAIILAAARLGIRLFDTAPSYGHGESERRLGDVVPELPGPIAVSTKVGKIIRPASPRRSVRRILGEAFADGPSGIAHLTIQVARRLVATVAPNRSNGPAMETTGDYSYDATMRSIEGSLKRARLDRFDLVFIHDPDDHLDAAMAGAYRALDRLRADGTITALGASSNQTGPLIRLAEAGAFDCFLLAGRYSLLDQSALDKLLPLARARGISIVIGGVFNGGLLADPAHKPTFDYEPATREQIVQARRIDDVCRRHGSSIAAAAVQFPFGHPAVTSVLIGVESVAELEEDVRLATTPLPASLWEDLRREGLIADGVPLPPPAGRRTESIAEA